jgi:hypothetical protein
MYYCIKCPDEKFFRICEQIAFQYDYQWLGHEKNHVISFSDKYFCLCPKKLCGGSGVCLKDGTEFKTLDEMIKHLQKEEYEEVNRINIEEYEVEFDSDGSIKVGCQNIDFDTITKIYQKASKLKDSTK